MLFQKLSKECYEWLNKQPSVKEESLTDWLLYQATQISNRVFYKTFTRNEEAHVGADWEWWILTEDRYSLLAYRLLIQAKKLKKDKNNYSAITYGNSNGMQIDLLLSSAVNRQALPLYAYYICSHPDIKEQIRNFSWIDKDYLRCNDKYINGVYLSLAFSIGENFIWKPKRKIMDKELINHSLGLSILDLLFRNAPPKTFLPCTSLDGLNQQFLNSCKNYILTDDNCQTGCANANHGFIYSYKDFPPYLKAILQSQEKNMDWIAKDYRQGQTMDWIAKDYRQEQIMDWLESEFHREFEGLSGIVVIDTRK